MSRLVTVLTPTTCFVFEVGKDEIGSVMESFGSYNIFFVVAAQGFTVLAMVGGSLYYTYKEQQLKAAAEKESSS